jgi:hypothetical protein
MTVERGVRLMEGGFVTKLRAEAGSSSSEIPTIWRPCEPY